MTTELNSGEQPAIAENSSTDVEVTADAAPAVNDTDATAEAKRKPGAEARIGELTWQAKQAERERDYWRDQATRQQPPKPEPAKAETPKSFPKLEDFNYDEAAYGAAVLAHTTEESRRIAREELANAETERQKTERTKSWKSRESEFRAKHADYEDKAYFAPMSDHMVSIIQESDNGPAIAYYLGNNREESERIRNLSAGGAAFALGRIEAKLELPPAPASAPKPVSKAPPPPPKIDATEPAVAKDISDQTLSDAEFDKIRKRQIAQRRNR